MDSAIKQLDFKRNKPKTFLIGVVLLVILISWVNFLDKTSTNYVDSALVQSTVAFGVARGMNALISTLQSTTLEFSLMAGISVSIGEMLDPLNDLVEDYSSLMKLSIGSLVIQKLLIEITSNSVFKIALTLSGILLITSIFMREQLYANFFFKSFVFLLFIRFALVSVIFMNGVIDRSFIQNKVDTNLKVIENTTTELENIGSTDNKTSVVRIGMLKSLEDARENKIKLDEDIAINKKSISDLESEISTANKEREELISQLSMVNRLNVFKSDDSTKGIDEMIQAKELELEKYRQIVNKLNDDLKLLNENIEEIEVELNGSSSALGQGYEKMKTQISNYANTLKMSIIKEKLEQSTANIMNIMALFIFKTLILPLLFLFLLMKGTNLIWDIDIKKQLKIKELDLI